jgi:hypothetical protein
MKAQYSNKVMSSMLAFLDHKVLLKGEAYENYGSLFYKTDTQLYEPTYETWAAPFKQMVCDESITGANIFTGINIDGDTAVSGGVGTSGIAFFNPLQGQVFFDSPATVTTASGNYAIKDFNTYLTSEAEEELLFSTKIHLRPRTNQTETGLAPETQTYPAIYIKDNGGSNKPWAFGGMDLTTVSVRAVVLADSAFRLDAVCSILKDTAHSHVCLLEPEDLPFNAAGGCTGVYDYAAIAGSKSSFFDIEDVFVSKYIENRADYQNLNKDVFSALVDFDLTNVRTPRQ